jgi:4-hydroxy-3-polyprenylbenzoate decarboxylase
LILPKRVVVGISGASGAALGMRTIELLAGVENLEIHLVISAAAERVVIEELGWEALRHARQMSSQVHACADVGACIASGSFRTDGMIIAPCSIQTLSAVAYGDADNLLTRAADVHLKERRPLVLMVRESPLHLGHLRAMTQVTEAGAILMPPVPPFYIRQASADMWIDQIARRALGLLDLREPLLAPIEWQATSRSAGTRSHRDPV